MSIDRVPLAGSAARAIEQTGSVRAAAPDLSLTVSVILRRNPQSADSAAALLSGTFERPTRGEAAAQMAADPADVAAVESFAATYHLQVTAADPETRTVKLAGTAQQCEQAFGVQLQQVSGADGATYLTYSGTIDLPADVAPAIVAVLGLDTHPAARARPQGAG